MALGVIGGCLLKCVIPMELMEPAMEEGVMWIALFSIAIGAAACLSVAAVMLQAEQGDFLRG